MLEPSIASQSCSFSCQEDADVLCPICLESVMGEAWQCGECSCRVHRECISADGSSFAQITRIKRCPQCRQDMEGLQKKATEPIVSASERKCDKCRMKIGVGAAYNQCAYRNCRAVWHTFHIIRRCPACQLNLHRAIQMNSRECDRYA